jgi:hypothetical protein
MIGIKPDHFPVFGRFMDTNFYLWTIIFIHGQEVLSGENSCKNIKIPVLNFHSLTNPAIPCPSSLLSPFQAKIEIKIVVHSCQV